ncbi:hypothetical protein [Proteiniclasticum ruminis]|uniref:Uncharacterized protein n=1 Tax=Proteiniclasticum ruminis TaxID=398199 RepID=A0A1I5EUK1_9CLOT|nr:hypothetical protein [Proteiniclasticum ruminis]SFO15184.1 hypothetical protein SAMN04488695_12123 [Proteiniclasticum ruminis]
MKVYGTAEILIYEEETSNILYSNDTEQIADALYLIEDDGFTGLLDSDNNSFLITFQKDVHTVDKQTIYDKVQEILGQHLIFRYDVDKALKYWIKGEK